VIDGVSAWAILTLQRFLYTHHLPKEEDCGEGLEVGEMARVANWFQTVALYERCMQKFRAGLNVGNVVALLVLAHDSGLAALEKTGMGCFEANAIVFQVCFL